MKKELNEIARGLKSLASDMENKLNWNDTDMEEVVETILSYADDITNLVKTIPDLDDLKAIDDYQKQAENLIENAINKELEDND